MIISNRRRIGGLAQIPVLVGMVLMLVAIPLATRLANQNQDTRNRAAEGCRTYGECCGCGRAKEVEECTDGNGNKSWSSGGCDNDAPGCTNGCSAPQPTSPPANNGGGGEGGSCCHSNSDCPAEHPNCENCQCKGGGCSGPNDCASWEVCENGSCKSKSGCSQDSDCMDGKKCKGGTCEGGVTPTCDQCNPGSDPGEGSAVCRGTNKAFCGNDWCWHSLAGDNSCLVALTPTVSPNSGGGGGQTTPGVRQISCFCNGEILKGARCPLVGDPCQSDEAIVSDIVKLMVDYQSQYKQYWQDCSGQTTAICNEQNERLIGEFEKNKKFFNAVFGPMEKTNLDTKIREEANRQDEATKTLQKYEDSYRDLKENDCFNPTMAGEPDCVEKLNKNQEAFKEVFPYYTEQFKKEGGFEAEFDKRIEAENKAKVALAEYEINYRKFMESGCNQADRQYDPNCVIGDQKMVQVYEQDIKPIYGGKYQSENELTAVIQKKLDTEKAFIEYQQEYIKAQTACKFEGVAGAGGSSFCHKVSEDLTKFWDEKLKTSGYDGRDEINRELTVKVLAQIQEEKRLIEQKKLEIMIGSGSRSVLDSKCMEILSEEICKRKSVEELITQFYSGADAKRLGEIYSKVGKVGVVVDSMLMGEELKRLRKKGLTEKQVTEEMEKKFGKGSIERAYLGVVTEKDLEEQFVKDNFISTAQERRVWDLILAGNESELEKLMKGGLVLSTQVAKYRKLVEEFNASKDDLLTKNKEIFENCQALGITGCDKPNEAVAIAAMGILDPLAPVRYEEQKICAANGQMLASLGWIEAGGGGCYLTDKTASYKDSKTPMADMVADLAKQNVRLSAVGNFIFFNGLTQGMVARGQDMIDGALAREARARAVEEKIFKGEELDLLERAYYESDDYKKDTEAWREIQRGQVMKWSPGVAAPVGVAAAVITTVATWGGVAPVWATLVGGAGVGMGIGAATWTAGDTWLACERLSDVVEKGECTKKSAFTGVMLLSSVTGAAGMGARVGLEGATAAGLTARAATWGSVVKGVTVADMIASTGQFVVFGDQALEAVKNEDYLGAVMMGAVSGTSLGRLGAGIFGLSSRAGLNRVSALLNKGAGDVDVVANYAQGSLVCAGALTGSAKIVDCVSGISNGALAHGGMMAAKAQVKGKTVADFPELADRINQIKDPEVAKIVNERIVRDMEVEVGRVARTVDGADTKLNVAEVEFQKKIAEIETRKSQGKISDSQYEAEMMGAVKAKEVVYFEVMKIADATIGDNGLEQRLARRVADLEVVETARRKVVAQGADEAKLRRLSELEAEVEAKRIEADTSLDAKLTWSADPEEISQARKAWELEQIRLNRDFEAKVADVAGGGGVKPVEPVVPPAVGRQTEEASRDVQGARENLLTALGDLEKAKTGWWPIGKEGRINDAAGAVEIARNSLNQKIEANSDVLGQVPFEVLREAVRLGKVERVSQGEKYRLAVADDASVALKDDVKRINDALTELEKANAAVNKKVDINLYKEQVDVLLTEKGILQLQAGGGKTSIVGPLLAALNKRMIASLPNSSEANSYVVDSVGLKSFYDSQGIEVVFYDSKRGFLRVGENFSRSLAEVIPLSEVRLMANEASVNREKGLLVITESSDLAWGTVSGRRGDGPESVLFHDMVLGERDYFLAVDEVGANVKGSFSVSKGEPAKILSLKTMIDTYGLGSGEKVLRVSQQVEDSKVLSEFRQQVLEKIKSGQATKDLFFEYVDPSSGRRTSRPYPKDMEVVGRSYEEIARQSLADTALPESNKVRIEVEAIIGELSANPASEKARKRMEALIRTSGDSAQESALIRDFDYRMADIQARWKVLSRVPENDFGFETTAEIATETRTIREKLKTNPKDKLNLEARLKELESIPAGEVVLRKSQGTTGESYSGAVDRIALQSEGLKMMGARDVDVSTAKGIGELTITPDSDQITNKEIYGEKLDRGKFRGYDATPDTAANALGTEATARSEEFKKPETVITNEDGKNLIRDGMTKAGDKFKGKAVAFVVADDGRSLPETTRDIVDSLSGRKKLARTKFITDPNGGEKTEYYIENITVDGDGKISRTIEKVPENQRDWGVEIQKILADDPGGLIIVYEGRTRAIDLSVTDANKEIKWVVVASDQNNMEDITQSWKRNRVPAKVAELRAKGWTDTEIESASQFDLWVRTDDATAKMIANEPVKYFRGILEDQMAVERVEMALGEMSQSQKRTAKEVEKMLTEIRPGKEGEIRMAVDEITAEAKRLERAQSAEILTKPLTGDEIPAEIYKRGREAQLQAEIRAGKIAEKFQLNEAEVANLRKVLGVEADFPSLEEFNRVYRGEAKGKANSSPRSPAEAVMVWAETNSPKDLPSAVWHSGGSEAVVEASMPVVQPGDGGGALSAAEIGSAKVWGVVDPTASVASLDPVAVRVAVAEKQTAAAAVVTDISSLKLNVPVSGQPTNQSELEALENEIGKELERLTGVVYIPGTSKYELYKPIAVTRINTANAVAVAAGVPTVDPVTGKQRPVAAIEAEIALKQGTGNVGTGEDETKKQNDRAKEFGTVRRSDEENKELEIRLDGIKREYDALKSLGIERVADTSGKLPAYGVFMSGAIKELDKQMGSYGLSYKSGDGIEKNVESLKVAKAEIKRMTADKIAENKADLDKQKTDLVTQITTVDNGQTRADLENMTIADLEAKLAGRQAELGRLKAEYRRLAGKETDVGEIQKLTGQIGDLVAARVGLVATAMTKGIPVTDSLSNSVIRATIDEDGYLMEKYSAELKDEVFAASARVDKDSAGTYESKWRAELKAEKERLGGLIQGILGGEMPTGKVRELRIMLTQAEQAATNRASLAQLQTTWNGLLLEATRYGREHGINPGQTENSYRTAIIDLRNWITEVERTRQTTLGKIRDLDGVVAGANTNTTNLETLNEVLTTVTKNKSDLNNLDNEIKKYLGVDYKTDINQGLAKALEVARAELVRVQGEWKRLWNEIDGFTGNTTSEPNRLKQKNLGILGRTKDVAQVRAERMSEAEVEKAKVVEQQRLAKIEADRRALETAQTEARKVGVITEGKTVKDLTTETMAAKRAVSKITIQATAEGLGVVWTEGQSAEQAQQNLYLARGARKNEIKQKPEYAGLTEGQKQSVRKDNKTQTAEQYEAELKKLVAESILTPLQEKAKELGVTNLKQTATALTKEIKSKLMSAVVAANQGIVLTGFNQNDRRSWMDFETALNVFVGQWQMARDMEIAGLESRVGVRPGAKFYNVDGRPIRTDYAGRKEDLNKIVAEQQQVLAKPVSTETAEILRLMIPDVYSDWRNLEKVLVDHGFITVVADGKWLLTQKGKDNKILFLGDIFDRGFDEKTGLKQAWVEGVEFPGLEILNRIDDLVIQGATVEKLSGNHEIEFLSAMAYIKAGNRTAVEVLMVPNGVEIAEVEEAIRRGDVVVNKLADGKGVLVRSDGSIVQHSDNPNYAKLIFWDGKPFNDKKPDLNGIKKRIEAEGWNAQRVADEINKNFKKIMLSGNAGLIYSLFGQLTPDDGEFGTDLVALDQYLSLFVTDGQSAPRVYHGHNRVAYGEYANGKAVGLDSGISRAYENNLSGPMEAKTKPLDGDGAIKVKPLTILQKEAQSRGIDVNQDEETLTRAIKGDIKNKAIVGQVGLVFGVGFDVADSRQTWKAFKTAVDKYVANWQAKALEVKEYGQVAEGKDLLTLTNLMAKLKYRKGLVEANSGLDLTKVVLVDNQTEAEDKVAVNKVAVEWYKRDVKEKIGYEVKTGDLGTMKKEVVAELKRRKIEITAKEKQLGLRAGAAIYSDVYRGVDYQIPRGEKEYVKTIQVLNGLIAEKTKSEDLTKEALKKGVVRQVGETNEVLRQKMSFVGERRGNPENWARLKVIMASEADWTRWETTEKVLIEIEETQKFSGVENDGESLEKFTGEQLQQKQLGSDDRYVNYLVGRLGARVTDLLQKRQAVERKYQGKLTTEEIIKFRTIVLGDEVGLGLWEAGVEAAKGLTEARIRRLLEADLFKEIGDRNMTVAILRDEKMLGEKTDIFIDAIKEIDTAQDIAYRYLLVKHAIDFFGPEFDIRGSTDDVQLRIYRGMKKRYPMSELWWGDGETFGEYLTRVKDRHEDIIIRDENKKREGRLFDPDTEIKLVVGTGEQRRELYNTYMQKYRTNILAGQMELKKELYKIITVNPDVSEQELVSVYRRYEEKYGWPARYQSILEIFYNRYRQTRGRVVAIKSTYDGLIGDEDSRKKQLYKMMFGKEARDGIELEFGSLSVNWTLSREDYKTAFLVSENTLLSDQTRDELAAKSNGALKDDTQIIGTEDLVIIVANDNESSLIAKSHEERHTFNRLLLSELYQVRIVPGTGGQLVTGIVDAIKNQVEMVARDELMAQIIGNFVADDNQIVELFELSYGENSSGYEYFRDKNDFLASEDGQRWLMGVVNGDADIVSGVMRKMSDYYNLTSDLVISIRRAIVSYRKMELIYGKERSLALLEWEPLIRWPRVVSILTNDYVVRATKDALDAGMNVQDLEGITNSLKIRELKTEFEKLLKEAGMLKIPLTEIEGKTILQIKDLVNKKAAVVPTQVASRLLEESKQTYLNQESGKSLVARVALAGIKINNPQQTLEQFKAEVDRIVKLANGRVNEFKVANPEINQSDLDREFGMDNQGSVDQRLVRAKNTAEGRVTVARQVALGRVGADGDLEGFLTATEIKSKRTVKEIDDLVAEKEREREAYKAKQKEGFGGVLDSDGKAVIDKAKGKREIDRAVKVLGRLYKTGLVEIDKLKPVADLEVLAGERENQAKAIVRTLKDDYGLTDNEISDKENLTKLVKLKKEKDERVAELSRGRYNIFVDKYSRGYGERVEVWEGRLKKLEEIMAQREDIGGRLQDWQIPANGDETIENEAGMKAYLASFERRVIVKGLKNDDYDRGKKSKINIKPSQIVDAKFDNDSQNWGDMMTIRSVNRFNTTFISMRDKGFMDIGIEPIEVVDMGEGRYVAVGGSHRVAAAMALGIKSIPVVVYPLKGVATAGAVFYQNDARGLKVSFGSDGDGEFVEAKLGEKVVRIDSKKLDVSRLKAGMTGMYREEFGGIAIQVMFDNKKQITLVSIFGVGGDPRFDRNKLSEAGSGSGGSSGNMGGQAQAPLSITESTDIENRVRLVEAKLREYRNDVGNYPKTADGLIQAGTDLQLAVRERAEVAKQILAINPGLATQVGGINNIAKLEKMLEEERTKQQLQTAKDSLRSRYQLTLEEDTRLEELKTREEVEQLKLEIEEEIKTGTRLKMGGEKSVEVVIPEERPRAGEDQLTIDDELARQKQVVAEEQAKLVQWQTDNQTKVVGLLPDSLSAAVIRTAVSQIRMTVEEKVRLAQLAAQTADILDFFPTVGALERAVKQVEEIGEEELLALETDDKIKEKAQSLLETNGLAEAYRRVYGINQDEFEKQVGEVVSHIYRRYFRQQIEDMTIGLGGLLSSMSWDDLSKYEWRQEMTNEEFVEQNLERLNQAIGDLSVQTALTISGVDLAEWKTMLARQSVESAVTRFNQRYQLGVNFVTECINESGDFGRTVANLIVETYPDPDDWIKKYDELLIVETSIRNAANFFADTDSVESVEIKLREKKYRSFTDKEIGVMVDHGLKLYDEWKTVKGVLVAVKERLIELGLGYPWKGGAISHDDGLKHYRLVVGELSTFTKDFQEKVRMARQGSRVKFMQRREVFKTVADLVEDLSVGTSVDNSAERLLGEISGRIALVIGDYVPKEELVGGRVIAQMQKAEAEALTKIPVELRGEIVGKDGKYQLIGELGRGQSGTTYIAKLTYSTGHVAYLAMKVEAIGIDEKIKLRNQTESELLREMEGYNVPIYFGEGVLPTGQKYKVMTITDGVILVDDVRQRTMSIDSAMEVIEKYLITLNKLHSLGFGYLDFQPKNLVWDDKSKSLTVIDFNLFDTDSRQTVTRDVREFFENLVLSFFSTRKNELDVPDFFGIHDFVDNAISGRFENIGELINRVDAIKKLIATYKLEHGDSELFKNRSVHFDFGDGDFAFFQSRLTEEEQGEMEVVVVEREEEMRSVARAIINGWIGVKEEVVRKTIEQRIDTLKGKNEGEMKVAYEDLVDKVVAGINWLPTGEWYEAEIGKLPEDIKSDVRASVDNWFKREGWTGVRGEVVSGFKGMFDGLAVDLGVITQSRVGEVVEGVPYVSQGRSGEDVAGLLVDKSGKVVGQVVVDGHGLGSDKSLVVKVAELVQRRMAEVTVASLSKEEAEEWGFRVLDELKETFANETGGAVLAFAIKIPTGYYVFSIGDPTIVAVKSINDVKSVKIVEGVGTNWNQVAAAMENDDKETWNKWVREELFSRRTTGTRPWQDKYGLLAAATVGDGGEAKADRQESLSAISKYLDEHPKLNEDKPKLWAILEGVLGGQRSYFTGETTEKIVIGSDGMIDNLLRGGDEQQKTLNSYFLFERWQGYVSKVDPQQNQQLATSQNWDDISFGVVSENGLKTANERLLFKVKMKDAGKYQGVKAVIEEGLSQVAAVFDSQGCSNCSLFVHGVQTRIEEIDRLSGSDQLAKLRQLRDYVFSHKFESNRVVEAGAKVEVEIKEAVVIKTEKEKNDALRAIDLAIQRIDEALGESGLNEETRKALEEYRGELEGKMLEVIFVTYDDFLEDKRQLFVGNGSPDSFYELVNDQEKKWLKSGFLPMEFNYDDIGLLNQLGRKIYALPAGLNPEERAMVVNKVFNGGNPEILLRKFDEAYLRSERGTDFYFNKDQSPLLFVYEPVGKGPQGEQMAGDLLVVLYSDIPYPSVGGQLKKLVGGNKPDALVLETYFIPEDQADILRRKINPNRRALRPMGGFMTEKAFAEEFFWVNRDGQLGLWSKRLPLGVTDRVDTAERMVAEGSTEFQGWKSEFGKSELAVSTDLLAKSGVMARGVGAAYALATVSLGLRAGSNGFFYYGPFALSDGYTDPSLYVNINSGVLFVVGRDVGDVDRKVKVDEAGDKQYVPLEDVTAVLVGNEKMRSGLLDGIRALEDGGVVRPGTFDFWKDRIRLITDIRVEEDVDDLFGNGGR